MWKYKVWRLNKWALGNNINYLRHFLGICHHCESPVSTHSLVIHFRASSYFYWKCLYGCVEPWNHCWPTAVLSEMITDLMKASSLGDWLIHCYLHDVLDQLLGKCQIPPYWAIQFTVAWLVYTLRGKCMSQDVHTMWVDDMFQAINGENHWNITNRIFAVTHS